MSQHSINSRRPYSFIKWTLQHANKISIVGTLVAVILLRRILNENAKYQYSQTIQNERRPYNKPRSVIAVINTPKTGGMGLSQSLIDSWKCEGGTGYPSYLTYNCPDERMVIRAHDFDAGAKAIQRFRQEYPGEQCLIVTAIRSPITWLPSLYAQQSRICEAFSMSKHDMLQDYRRFLGDMNMIVESAESCLPGLMTEFNGGSLKEQTKIMDYTGGYSVLGHPSSGSAYAGCELLLLRMEQNDRWPGFIKKFVPDSKFYRGETHLSQCPELSDHIKMIQDYELTKEEKMALYNSGSAIMSDWFDSYRYIEGSSQIIKDSHSTPGSVIAVITTPKTGTTSLTQNFKNGWKCEKVDQKPFFISYECPDERLLVRSHQFGAGAQVVQQHRQEHPAGHCLLVTSIRNPVDWLPSLYYQKENICKNTSVTKNDMLEDYKLFLANQSLILTSAETALPGLMREFTFGSLKEQAKIMDQNGGYSILSPAFPGGTFAGCELLLLRMEQHEQWPEVIKSMVPEIKFSKGKSGASQCPELADHIKMLQNYELTMEERTRIYNYGGGLMADWFDAYEDTGGVYISDQ